MSFKKKIDKILETNQLGVNSIYALEKAIEASTGSVNKYYNKDESPGPGIIKKIKKTFSIDDIGWQTGEFNGPHLEPSRESLKKVFDKEVEKEMLTMEMWKQVQKDTDKKDEQIRNLWRLIERLELPGDAVKSVPTDNS